MTTPTKVEVNDDTREVLGALALGDPDLLAEGLEARANWKGRSGLDGRSYALVKLAALIALDAPPASYIWQVGNALAEGATPEDLVGVLIVLVLLPLHRLPGMALPGHVRAAADHGRAQQRTSPPEHNCLLAIVALYAVGQAEAQREHELGRGRHQLRAPDLRGDRDQDAHQVLRGGTFR